MSLEALFCDVDDFCQTFLPHWQHEQLTHGERQRRRPGQLSVSEIMTIIVYFHPSHYRHFKGLFSGRCETSSPGGFSWVSELLALGGLDAFGLDPLMCLSPAAQRASDGAGLYRGDFPRRLP
jgi:hypothetical protein